MVSGLISKTVVVAPGLGVTCGPEKVVDVVVAVVAVAVHVVVIVVVAVAAVVLTPGVPELTLMTVRPT